MFEHWRQLVYFDNESSQFPSDDILDELELYDSAPRMHVRRAFERLVDDFTQYLRDMLIYDYFCAQQYARVLVKNETFLFF